MHDKRRSPKVSNNIFKQLQHGRGLASIASIAAYAMHLLQFLQDRFVWVSSCDSDTDAVLRKQPCTTGADAGASPNNQCNIWSNGTPARFCHVSCSYTAVGGNEGMHPIERTAVGRRRRLLCSASQSRLSIPDAPRHCPAAARERRTGGR